MPKPFLNLGDIGLVRERVGGGRGAQRVHAQAVHLAVDARREPVMADDVAIDRSAIERSAQSFRCAIVLHGPEEEAFGVGTMPGSRKILLDQPLCRGVHRDEPDFVPLAQNPEMDHALAAVHVPDLQPARFFA